LGVYNVELRRWWWRWFEVLVMQWLMMRNVIESRRWWRDRIIWRGWVGIGLLALLLLVEDIKTVL
jgi:hypothetical protein